MCKTYTTSVAWSASTTRQDSHSIQTGRKFKQETKSRSFLKSGSPTWAYFYEIWITKSRIGIVEAQTERIPFEKMKVFYDWKFCVLLWIQKVTRSKDWDEMTQKCLKHWWQRLCRLHCVLWWMAFAYWKKLSVSSPVCIVQFIKRNYLHYLHFSLSISCIYFNPASTSSLSDRRSVICLTLIE